MKIVLINGSPKVKKSASSVLLEDLKIQLCEKAQIVEAAFHTSTVSEETLEELRNADAWVFAYPLYVDGIPAHLLSCLVQLEEAHLKDRQIHIYGIVNCGFYEGTLSERYLYAASSAIIYTGLARIFLMANLVKFRPFLVVI